MEAVYADENVWLTQKMMGLLYDVEPQTINFHLKKIFADQELPEDSVTRNFRITAADGKNYDMALRQIPKLAALRTHKQGLVQHLFPSATKAAA